jgi:dTDP-4-dehydrorhamnose 3,5-epimerase
VVGRDELDLADPASIGAFDLAGVGTVLNAAAYTAVDAAEAQGRREAWAANATGVAALARAAAAHRLTLVHYSTDYVYDGTGGSGEGGAWSEDDAVCPLGVYGQSKAAGDTALSLTSRHYLLRTSWVVGEGANFVATMRRLAQQGVHPKVVDDQVGRLTFTDDLAAATAHLLGGEAAYGTYNVTNGGRPGSWADIARQVFEHEGRDPGDVTPVSTADYTAGASGPDAPRPARSTLDLTKLRLTGHQPADQWSALTRYLQHG